MFASIADTMPLFPAHHPGNCQSRTVEQLATDRTFIARAHALAMCTTQTRDRCRQIKVKAQYKLAGTSDRTYENPVRLVAFQAPSSGACRGREDQDGAAIARALHCAPTRRAYLPMSPMFFLGPLAAPLPAGLFLVRLRPGLIES